MAVSESHAPTIPHLRDALGLKGRTPVPRAVFGQGREALNPYAMA